MDDHIDTGHILLGLLREQEGRASRALSALGVTTERVRGQLPPTGGGKPEIPVGHIAVPFTPRAKQIFSAATEDVGIGHYYVDTEDLLLALIRDPDSTASRILARMQVEPGEIRSEVERVKPPLHGHKH